jgi:hypothetical protein
MDENQTYGLIGLGAVVWLLILYAIIKGSVRSANDRIEHYLKGLHRMKIKEMQKQGYSKADLELIQSQTEKEFWIDVIDPPKKANIDSVINI